MKKSRARRVFDRAFWTLATLAILLALATAAFRLVVPLVPQYRADVEAWAASVLGAPVDIDALDLRWRGLRPELVFDGVRYVSADASRAFAAAQVRVALSVGALVRGRVVPARITLAQPDLTLVLDTLDGAPRGDGWRSAFAGRDRRGEVEIDGGRLTLVADQGRRRYSFDAIDAVAASDGDTHRLELVMQASAAGTMSLSVRARGWPDTGDLAGELTASVSGADVRALQALAGEPSVDAGTVDATLDLRFDHARVQEARAELAFARLVWPGGRRHGGDAAVHWLRRAGGWDVTLATAAHADAQPLALAYTESTGDGVPAYWRATGSAPRLGDLIPLARAASPWLPAQVGAWLAREPRGRLESLDFSVRRVADGATEWTLGAAVTRLALAADAASGVPGFAGIDAAIDASSDRGRAEVGFRRAHVYLPQTFRAPMPVSSGELVVDWHRADGGWVVEIPSVDVVGPHARADGVARIVTRPGDEPLLHLDIAFDDVVLASHEPYLPVSVMPASVVAWLDRAVVGGHGTRGVFRYDGPAGGVALANDDATMEVSLDATGIALEFADGWPALVDGAAHLVFDGHGFRATMSAGTLGGAPLAADVVLADYGAPTLAIAGGSDADLGVLLDAFRATPVGDAGWLDAARAAGPAKLELDVAVPLADDAETSVDGRVVLEDASLTLTGFSHPLTAIRGALSIREDGVSADAVAGTLLDQPVAITAATVRDAQGVATAVDIGFRGTVTAGVLASLAERELPATGAFQWRGALRAPYDGATPTLTLHSDLAGLAIDLPAPLGKAASDARPLSVTVMLDERARRFDVDGADGLAADGVFERADGAWTLARARVRFGGGPELPMPEAGIAVGGRLSHWRQGVDDGLAADALSATAPLVALDVEVGELELYGRGLGTVRVDGERAPGGWFWVLHGERLSGSVDLPDAPANERPIRIELEYARLPEVGDAVDAVASRVAATKVPPIAFYAGSLRVGERDFGEVSGLLARIENGIALEGFTATRPEARLVAEGTWRTVDGYHRTTLRGTLDSTDVRETLAALGYAASVEASAGHVEADLHWMDSIVADPLPTLGGVVTMRIERGALLDVEAGAGRVFGLLSLSALPRRLALDFRDVFRRGLSFDTITGHFTITDGDAFSDDLELVGPAVRIAVRGRTGLASRDYDQHAEVTASLASSLTLAGALAGGPGVGAAMLIASELFRGQLDDIARVRYRVTGPWDAPSIDRVAEPR